MQRTLTELLLAANAKIEKRDRTNEFEFGGLIPSSTALGAALIVAGICGAPLLLAGAGVALLAGGITGFVVVNKSAKKAEQHFDKALAEITTRYVAPVLDKAAQEDGLQPGREFIVTTYEKDPLFVRIEENTPRIFEGDGKPSYDYREVITTFHAAQRAQDGILTMKPSYLARKNFYRLAASNPS